MSWICMPTMTVSRADEDNVGNADMLMRCRLISDFLWSLYSYGVFPNAIKNVAVAALYGLSLAWSAPLFNGHNSITSSGRLRSGQLNWLHAFVGSENLQCLDQYLNRFDTLQTDVVPIAGGFPVIVGGDAGRT